MYLLSGGDGNDVGMNVGGEEGLGDSPDKLADFLKRLRTRREVRRRRKMGPEDRRGDYWSGVRRSNICRCVDE